METIAKAFKFIGGVNMFIGDWLEQVLTIYKFSDKVRAFINEYPRKHPDEFETVYSSVPILHFL